MWIELEPQKGAESTRNGIPLFAVFVPFRG
jgi:hypothetical protein